MIPVVRKIIDWQLVETIYGDFRRITGKAIQQIGRLKFKATREKIPQQKAKNV
jgi:hypothetical protein